jgi:UDPglucose 6-dehydrogenase
VLTISVTGLWHLGSVTAACLASVGHNVIGIDEDPAIVAALARARPPFAEAGLDEMLEREIAAGRLCFSTRFEDVAKSDVVWVAYDTPVDESDSADAGFVLSRALRLLDHMKDASVLVVSSQIPVGSVARIEREFESRAKGRRIGFASVPENLRLGEAINVFLQPDRVVIGVRNRMAQAALEAVYHPFTDRIEWMSVESAEMTKHAINSFLATSVCFTNELATICEITGADAMEVERGLKTDGRIGHLAYLHPGGAIAGGTLVRDLGFLRSLGQAASASLHLINGVHASNEYHKGWLERRMGEALGPLEGLNIAILGLAYKPGTNTLRRSAAVEIARWLRRMGARVQAFDPQLQELPEELRPVISLHRNIADALWGADALVVATQCPEFQLLNPELAPPVVFDAARWLETSLGGRAGIRYYAIGRANAA